MRLSFPKACAVFAVLFLIAWNFPISNFLTRSGTIVLLLAFAITLVITVWPKPILRWLVVSFLALLLGFVFFPSKKVPPTEELRRAYTSALSHYTGTRYVWGGESWTGIDCSGLIRRAMFDALISTGLRDFSPEAIRRAFSLWWHDSSARHLGEGQGGTISLRIIPSIHKEPPANLLPGDLAVTKSGVHILAYLGDGRWIDADPGAAKVRISPLDSKENGWMDDPMQLVRWALLTP